MGDFLSYHITPKACCHPECKPNYNGTKYSTLCNIHFSDIFAYQTNLYFQFSYKEYVLDLLNLMLFFLNCSWQSNYLKTYKCTFAFQKKKRNKLVTKIKPITER